MEHKKLNRIFGFAVFLIALVGYGKTVAPTTSYWDCGEFIASSYILGVPHPPGAPLFILVGRVFTMIPAWLIEDVGLRVNMISVLMSAFSVMFAYLIIVRLVREFRGIPETIEQKINIYASAVIGALGFAFTSAQWFNAVEAEVYAVSIFFTTIVVWLILVWTERVEDPVSDKLLLLIAYLIGLATGVHLLNILAIPTLFLIMYFKKAELGLKTFLLWAAGGAAAFGAVYPGIVQGIPWLLNRFSFMSIGLVVLILLFGIYYSVQNRNRILSLTLMSILLVSIGYSTYTALYVRSGMQPAINENHPDTPEKFVSYLNREQYGDIPLTVRRAPMWDYQIKKMYIRYFGWQFIGEGTTLGRDNYIAETISTKGLTALPFLVGLIGMVFHFSRDWKRSSAILALFIMTGVAITIYLNQEDPQPRERDYAYVGSFFAFSLWIGMGASAILELVQKSFRQNSSLKSVGIGLTLLLLFVAVPFNLYRFNVHSHDRTGNFVAYDYSYNILQSCEPNAILFTNGDNDTFPLWYLQYVEGIRQDVRVVNLSLLNTPWYIKQLRDEEPKVAITLSDEQIDALTASLWEEPKTVRIQVPRSRLIEQLEKKEDNASISPEDIPQSPMVEFELTHTKTISGHPVLLVQDRMIVHILAANQFKKPVYFAVTVSPTNMLNLDNRRGKKDLKNYLRMDGLTYRVMPYGGPQNTFIAAEKLEANLFRSFQYRNLNNPDVYLNNNVLGLLQNYRAAFSKLANYHDKREMSDESSKQKRLAVLNKMEEVMPETVVPLRDFSLSLNFARMYSDLGEKDILRQRLERIPKIYNLGPVDKLYLAEFYVQLMGENAKAESLAVSVKQQRPDVRQTYQWLASHYTRSKQYAQAKATLQEWLSTHPEDIEMQSQLVGLKRFASGADSVETSNGVDSLSNHGNEKP